MYISQITIKKVFKWAKGYNCCFLQEDIKIANRYMQKFLRSVIIRKLQIKTVVGYYLMFVSWLSTKRLGISSVRVNMKKSDPPTLLVEM